MIYIQYRSDMTIYSILTLNVVFTCYIFLNSQIHIAVGGVTPTRILNSTAVDDEHTSKLPEEINQSPVKLTARIRNYEQQVGSQTRGSAKPSSDRVATTREIRPISPAGTSIRRTNDSIVITELRPQQTTQTSQSRSPKLLHNKDDILERSLFRENAPDYPEEEISVALKRLPEPIRELFNMQNSPLDPAINLTERTASYPEHYISADEGREENVCRTVLRNIYPREAHRDNNLVYIPNNHEFMQVIQSELCVNPDGDCSYLQDALPYGMTSACHQKYAFKKMLYYDPLEKRMASDVFRYPSCCVCHVKTLPLDLRSAKSTTASTTTTATSTTTTPMTTPVSSMDLASDTSGGAIVS